MPSCFCNLCSVFTSDPSKFVSGLKSIAKVLLGCRSEEADEINSPPTKNLYGLTEFVSAADELWESNDLTLEQYIAVIHAILSGHEEAENLFNLHCNPDFILACNDDELRSDLLRKDIMVLGTSIPPIDDGPSDELLKHAIYTGLHNFGTELSSPLPTDFRNIIFHMFSSGDGE